MRHYDKHNCDANGHQNNIIMQEKNNTDYSYYM